MPLELAHKKMLYLEVKLITQLTLTLNHRYNLDFLSIEYFHHLTVRKVHHGFLVEGPFRFLFSKLQFLKASILVLLKIKYYYCDRLISHQHLGSSA